MIKAFYIVAALLLIRGLWRLDWRLEALETLSTGMLAGVLMFAAAIRWKK